MEEDEYARYEHHCLKDEPVDRGADYHLGPKDLNHFNIYKLLPNLDIHSSLDSFTISYILFMAMSFLS
jgi:hypothetical protein